jgi:hypothetical protein
VEYVRMQIRLHHFTCEATMLSKRLLRYIYYCKYQQVHEGTKGELNICICDKVDIFEILMYSKLQCKDNKAYDESV